MRLRREVERLRKDVDRLYQRVCVLECSHPDAEQTFAIEMDICGIHRVQKCLCCGRRVWFDSVQGWKEARKDCYERIIDATSDDDEDEL